MTDRMSTNESLNRLMNRLRNQALGRGTTPLVSPELAKEVGDAWEFWRVARNSTISQADLQNWVHHYNWLRAAVNAERPEAKLPEAPPAGTILERAVKPYTGKGFKDFAITVGAGVAVAIILSALKKR